MESYKMKWFTSCDGFRVVQDEMVQMEVFKMEGFIERDLV